MPVTKPELLAALRNGERETLDKLLGVPAEAFERGCYDNHRTRRQLLAHTATLECTDPEPTAIATRARPTRAPSSSSISARARPGPSETTATGSPQGSTIMAWP
jgi:hypothetical protein